MEINEYLIKLIQTTKDLECLDFFTGDAQLGKTEFRLLREIVMEGENGGKIISSQLARRLGITRSAVSQIVTKLEKKNIVKRVDSPTDKKIVYVQLSDRALALFEAQCEQANALMERVVKEFGEDRIRELILMYDEFSAVLNRVREEFSRS